ncbi:MAG: hypothetical protein M3R49_01520 [Chloroflexota bacterium]|nr:hypothetical protein [Chloroflexota bacterium]
MREDAARALAGELRRRGLAAPAGLLLDAHRPLAPLIGIAATFLGPLLRSVGGRRGGDLVELLEGEDGLDRLAAALDG